MSGPGIVTARDLGTAWECQDGLRDSTVLACERPIGTQPDEHSPRADRNLCGGFDESLTPSAGEAFAQRVIVPTSVEVGAALASRECLGGDGLVQVFHIDGDLLRRCASQAGQQIQGGGM